MFDSLPRATDHPTERLAPLGGGLGLVLAMMVMMVPPLVVVGVVELAEPVSRGPAGVVAFAVLLVALYAAMISFVVAVLQTTQGYVQIGIDGIEHRTPDERTFVPWREVHDVRHVDGCWRIARADGPPIFLGARASKRARQALDLHRRDDPVPELGERLAPPGDDVGAWLERLRGPLPTSYRSRPRRDGLRAVLRHPRTEPLVRVAVAARLSAGATREERRELRAVGRACACTRVRRALVKLSDPRPDVASILADALAA